MSEAAEISMAADGPSKSGKLLNLVSALLAGLITWGFLHTQDPVFVVPAEFQFDDILTVSSRKIDAFRAHSARVDRLNLMLYMGVLGGLFGSSLALVKSPCCSAWVRISIALPWGILSGAVAGFVGSAVYRAIEDPSTIMDTVKVQSALFASLGTGLGLLIGAFARPAQILAGGATGAVAGALAGMVYPIATSLLLPSATTEFLIPDGATVRLLWIGIFVVSVALIVPLAAATAPRKGKDKRKDLAKEQPNGA